MSYSFLKHIIYMSNSFISSLYFTLTTCAYPTLRLVFSCETPSGMARYPSEGRPQGFCEEGARTQRPASDGHDVPRRPPVAAGHPSANLRHEANCTLHGLPLQQPLQSGELGRWVLTMSLNHLLDHPCAGGARCSSSLIHGAMGCQIHPSWWTHWAISLSSHCSTTGVTKAVLCVILFVGWWI